MKKFLFAIALSFSFNLSNAQDSLKHFEFGSTLLTVNSLNNEHFFITDKSPVEFMNGLFFRYTKNRFGFRTQFNYSKNYSSYHNQTTFTEGFGAGSTNKNFEINIGGQYSLLKKKDWLYTFVDISYRHQFSKGITYSSGYGVNSFVTSINGINTAVGLGFKIKTFKNVYLSPEVGLNSFNYNQKYSSVNMSTGEVQNSNFNHLNNFRLNAGLSPYLKLHLTFKFK